MEKRDLVFEVFLYGQLIETVFYSIDTNATAEEVKADLVNHDGYHPSIVVQRLWEN